MWQPQSRANMGVGASVFHGGYHAPGAAVPAVSPASAQASHLTVGQDGNGVVVPGMVTGRSLPGQAAIIGGTACLIGLGFLWWSLPLLAVIGICPRAAIRGSPEAVTLLTECDCCMRRAGEGPAEAARVTVVRAAALPRGMGGPSSRSPGWRWCSPGGRAGWPAPAATGVAAGGGGG
ncbi:MAG: hypothetical protein ACLPS1_27520 [Streptosporangiaceae bacterium]|jgi:hypothetical protein